MRSLPLARPFFALAVLLLAVPVVRAWVAAQEPDPQDGPPEFVVTGRVLLPDGEPAVGATIQLNRWSEHNAREQDLGLPDLRLEPSTTTDEDGAFELPFRLRPNERYSVEVSAPDCAHRWWMFHDLDADSSMDLGEIPLDRSGSLRVRVVDPDGAPAEGTWAVLAFAADASDRGAPLRGAHGSMEEVDASTGVALLQGLAAEAVSSSGRGTRTARCSMKCGRGSSRERRPRWCSSTTYPGTTMKETCLTRRSKSPTWGTPGSGR